MSFFDVNYNNLVWQLLPVRLRQSVMYAWLKTLVSPVKWLYDQFTANRSANLYRLAHDSQVCFLEAVLNDTFDPVTRAIYISDGAIEDPLYVYLEDEDKPLWVGLASEAGSTVYPDPEILYLDSETYADGFNFIVHVPVLVFFDTARLRALVDSYRLPGKTYTIVTF